jgi:hypothetical protein
MKQSPIERAALMAEKAKIREAPVHDWWTITRPGCLPMEVYFNPSASFHEVAGLYPGAAVVQGKQ